MLMLNDNNIINILYYLDSKECFKLGLTNKNIFNISLYVLKKKYIFITNNTKKSILLSKRGFKIYLDLSYNNDMKNIKLLSKYKPFLYKLNIKYCSFLKNVCLSIKNIEHIILIHAINIKLFDIENSKLKSIYLCSTKDCTVDKQFFNQFNNTDVKIYYIENLKKKIIEKLNYYLIIH